MMIPPDVLARPSDALWGCHGGGCHCSVWVVRVVRVCGFGGSGGRGKWMASTVLVSTMTRVGGLVEPVGHARMCGWCWCWW